MTALGYLRAARRMIGNGVDPAEIDLMLEDAENELLRDRGIAAVLANRLNDHHDKDPWLRVGDQCPTCAKRPLPKELTRV